jgi:hypothetical protein
MTPNDFETIDIDLDAITGAGGGAIGLKPPTHAIGKPVNLPGLAMVPDVFGPPVVLHPNGIGGVPR